MKTYTANRLAIYVWLFLALSAVLIVLGCAVGNLDTVNKRFAAFEISYKSALAQIDSLQKADKFKPETAAKVASLLVDVNKARNAAYIAKDSGDILKAQDQISLAIAVLDRLKEVLPQEGQL